MRSKVLVVGVVAGLAGMLAGWWWLEARGGKLIEPPGNPPQVLRSACFEQCTSHCDRRHTSKLFWTGESWDCYCHQFSAYPSEQEVGE